VKTLTSCSFNMADISTSSRAASNWFTLEIATGITDRREARRDCDSGSKRW
jgi:hypothetical protein